MSQQQIAYGIAAIGIESAFNPDAESPTGPYGLGQFSTDTWNEAVAYYNSNYGGNLDPAQSRDDVSAQIAVMGAWTSKI
ncbi:MAG: transglycosylase SLT domain-containing protein [bacterium]